MSQTPFLFTSAARIRSNLSRGSRATILRVLAMLIVILAIPGLTAPASASTDVGPKTYYVSLGDSLAFGAQPNGDWAHGYADQWFSELKTEGSKALVNYSCMDETTVTMINGNCPFRLFTRTQYTPPQLTAAVNFIKAHPGQVSPVSLDIGVNDIRPYIGTNICLAYPRLYAEHLATVDANLTQTILPALIQAVTNRSGIRTAEIVLVDYYDPYQNACPLSDAYIQELNQHLKADAAKLGVWFADIHADFNPGPIPDEKLCVYTWMCTEEHNVHPSGGQPGEPGNGYLVITQAVEQALGY